MMRFLLLAGLFFASSAFAGAGTGIGVVIGSPNGVTARHWLTEERSLEGSLGWALTKSRFEGNLNYLFSQPDAVEIGTETFDFFYGAGLSLRTKSGKADGELVFGPRLPVGLSYEFSEPEIEIFTAFALNVGLIPSSELYLDLNLGVRFYFF